MPKTIVRLQRKLTQAELDSFLEKAADLLRGGVDHSEFRGYVFALLFYKRINDVYLENVAALESDLGDPDLATDPRMHDFVVPQEAVWESVARKSERELGKALNDAMLAIERANEPKFNGILYNTTVDFNAQDRLPRKKLVEIINHFGSRSFDRSSVPDDVFGNAYEYLIRNFASKAGKSSGEFYTPREVAYLMSEIVEPQPGHHVCDWAAGSAGLLLQCRNYVARHFGRRDADRLFFYMQESNPSTANIARINMILHGVRGFHQAPPLDSLRAPHFREGQTKRLRQFDRIVMNPPFSLESWGYDDFVGGDPYDRFGFGMPPRDNGDYAWLEHVIKSLKPTGRAIVVMSQGILFRGQPEQTEAEDGRNQKADAEYVIRERLIKSDLIEAVIVLPSKLFYGNNVPGCLVVLNKRKPAQRRGQIVLVWASRDYESSNPQNILRRADCLRVLVPWRAFGNIAQCSALVPEHEKALVDEIEVDRRARLQDLESSFGPILEPLKQLRSELDDLKNRTEEPQPADKHVKKLWRDAKKTRTDRAKQITREIKALEKTESEYESRRNEITLQADREVAFARATAADLLRICSSEDEARRYFAVVEASEMALNEFNLNVPRYVDTFPPEQLIPIEEALSVVTTASRDYLHKRRTLRRLLGNGDSEQSPC